MRVKLLIFLIAFFAIAIQLNAQENRFEALERKLIQLSVTSAPGLKQKVDISVSKASIQEFVRGIAKSNDLNVSIDPSIDAKVINNFANEPAMNVLLFLCKEYELEIDFTGSIMSLKKYTPLKEEKQPVKGKPINLKYDSRHEKITLDLKNDTLEQVAKAITRATGRNIVLQPGLNTQLVSVYLEDMALQNALEKLSYANGLEVQKSDDDVFHIEKTELQQTPKTQPTTSSRGRRNVNTGSQQSGPQGFELGVTETETGRQLVSVNAVNTPIVDMLKAVAKELGIDYYLFTEPEGNTSLNVDAVPFEEFLASILQGTRSTFRKEKGIYLVGDRNLEGLRETKVVQLQHRSAKDIIDFIPADMKEGVEIKYFPELNSLILSGSNPNIYEITSFIKDIDKIVPMVMIEVMVIEVNKGRTVSAGVQAGLSDSVPSVQRIFPGLDYTFSAQTINNLLSIMGNRFTNINLGRVTPDFYISLKALEDNNYVKIRSTPQLSTLNGNDATLTIGRTEYYRITQTNTIGTQNPSFVTTEQWIPTQANLSINISPIVSGDDQVTLNIQVEMTDFTNSNPGTNAPPGTSTRQFESMVRIKNNEMVVLGGLEKSEKSRGSTGLPFLARIPVISWLFGTKSSSKREQKTMIFIRPTLIY